MRGRVRAALALAVIAAAAVALTAGVTPTAGAAALGAAVPTSPEISVAITSPRRGQPSFGELDFAVEVFATETVTRVELFVDGEKVGEVTQRPYRVRVDVGWDNRPHTYRAIAHGLSGLVVDEELVTPAAAVDSSIEVNLQQLFVTAERAGGRALDLGRGDFTVIDGGARQELVTFERGEVPFTAVVLLDVSESMRGVRLEKALAGARAFVGGLSELDQATVMLFSDQLLAATPFSNRPAVLTAPLETARAAGGTALNDHLYLALKKLELTSGRPVVVLLSDGTDAHSALPMEQVLWKAGRSQALIYWLLLEGEHRTSGDTISTAWRDGETNRRQLELLEKAVGRSGGRVLPITGPEELEAAFADVLAELRQQYVLGYYPSSGRSDGGWRQVRVRVAEPGVRVRHRGGYVEQ